MSDTDDQLLQKIADTDDLNGSDWNDVRNTIRTKLEQNVASFELTSPPAPPPFDATPSTQGGLRIAPFPQKKLNQLHLYDPPLSYMNAEQVKDALQAVLDQLESFDDGPPFTLQRLCELLLEPKRHYKSIGKYLRAVEKSILVTSSHDSFPFEPSTSVQPPSAPSNGTHTTIAFATRSTPSTPLFSPIPFLHEDARLSRSRSRSISPTRLSGDEHREGTVPPTSPTPEPATPLLLSAELPSKQAEVETEPESSVGLGMVDELDDPSPGHMSDAPTPLTAAASRGKPFITSLQDRFVKSEATEQDEKEFVPPSTKKVKLENSEEASSAKEDVKGDTSEKMETDADSKS